MSASYNSSCSALVNLELNPVTWAKTPRFIPAIEHQLFCLLAFAYAHNTAILAGQFIGFPSAST